MGLGPEAIQVGDWNVGKSNGKKKKDDEDDEGTAGCWFKFRFIGSCLSSKAKVDGSISGSGTSTLYGKKFISFESKFVSFSMHLLDLFTHFLVFVCCGS